MSTATLRLQYQTIYHKISSLYFIKIRWKLVYLLAIVFSSILLIFYIFQVNTLIRGAFLIKNYNKQVSSLSSQNRVLQTSFAERGFLGGVETKAQQLNFKKTTKVTYIQILQSALAEAR